ncbi:hypothetical protein ATANTOWER_017547, partial [Ataeniobius toweri]|nr:hypothetical protein [Ataeniobius toweri]
ICCFSYSQMRQLRRWLDMEREDCLPHSVRTIKMSPIRLGKPNYSYNLRALSLTLALYANPSFIPFTLDWAFDGVGIVLRGGFIHAGCACVVPAASGEIRIN